MNADLALKLFGIGVALSTGLFQVLGIPEGGIKVFLLVISLIVAFCYLYSILIGRAISFPRPMTTLWIIGLLMIVINWITGARLVGLLLFAFQYFLLTLFLVRSTEVTQGEIKQFYKFFTICVAAQVPAICWKLVSHGIDEKAWIGTLHHTAGQLGILFPMMGISLFFSRYLVMGQRANLIIVLFLIIFALINEKRSVVLLIPAMLLLLYLLSTRANKDQQKESEKRSVKRAILLAVLCIIALVGGVKIIPSLNPEQSYGGGSFSLDYLITYIIEYSFRGYESNLNNVSSALIYDTGIQLGRFAVIESVIKHFYSSDISTEFLGAGIGYASSSHLISDDPDRLFSATGIRGAISYVWVMLIETGLIGALGIVVWLYSTSKFILTNIKRAFNPEDKILNLMCVGFNFTVIYDSIFYSTVFWTTGILSPLYFYAIGILYSRFGTGRNVFRIRL